MPIDAASPPGGHRSEDPPLLLPKDPEAAPALAEKITFISRGVTEADAGLRADMGDPGRLKLAED